MGRIHSRLDRVYLSPQIENIGGQVGIIHGSIFSCHKLVEIELANVDAPQRMLTIRIPNNMIHNDDIKNNIISIWSSKQNLHSVVVNLELNIQEMSTTLKEDCRKELTRFKLQEARLRRSIVSAQ